MAGQEALRMPRCEWARLPHTVLAPGKLGSGGLKSVYLLLQLLCNPLLPWRTKPDESDLGQRSLGARKSLLLRCLIVEVGAGKLQVSSATTQKSGPDRSKRKWDLNRITGDTGIRKGLRMV